MSKKTINGEITFYAYDTYGFDEKTNRPVNKKKDSATGKFVYSGKASDGTKLTENYVGKVCAVDFKIIPKHSKVTLYRRDVKTNKKQELLYKDLIARDKIGHTKTTLQGSNTILDVFLKTTSECLKKGRLPVVIEYEPVSQK